MALGVVGPDTALSVPFLESSMAMLSVQEEKVVSPWPVYNIHVCFVNRRWSMKLHYHHLAGNIRDFICADWLNFCLGNSAGAVRTPHKNITRL